MRSFLPICAGLLVVSGIVSVSLWRELRAERQARAELQAPLAQPKSQEPAPAAPALPVQSANDPQPPVANTQPAAISPALAPAAKAVATSGLMSTDPATVAATRLELLKDPEYRKARIAQIRASQIEGYPGLVEELGLSGSEADQLFDLLAELQLSTNMETNALAASRADEQTTQQETARIQQEARRKRQEALGALLGTAKFAQWQQYQQTLPARAQATAQLTSVLAAAGQPVSSTQLQPVAAAMALEQRRQSEELQSMFRDAGTMDAQGRAKLQAEVLSRQEQSNRRVLDAASAHLSSGQLAALRSSLEQQVAQARESIRLQQQRVAP